MHTEFGRDNSINIDRIYIETEIDNEYTAYSYPSVLLEGSNLNNRILLDPPYITSQFSKLKQQPKKTMIDFSSFDVATGTKRIGTMFHSLVNSAGQFIGAITWEMDITKLLTNMILPPSFKAHKIPFMQLRLP